ncbi:MAG: hypothetical protein N2C14_12150, partial [Planctomycetales bacterium]
MRSSYFSHHLLVLILLLPSFLQAADFEWQDLAGGTFNLSADWKNVTTLSGPPAGPPGAADTAIFDLSAGTPYTVGFNADITNNQLIIRNDDLVFDLGGFTYSLNNSGVSAYIGESVGDVGALTVNNGSLSAAGVLYVGSNGTGTLTIQNAQVSDTVGFIGTYGGSVGTADVGAGGVWVNSGSLRVGNYGAGTLNITGGGQVSNTTGWIGTFAGASGEVAISGVGSTWTNSSAIYVGRAAGALVSGTMTVEKGGQVTNTVGYIGNDSGAVGIATVDDADGLGS